MSPMSAAKQRGEHYTVKEPKIPGGYLCLHCGLGGDVRDIRSKKCTPSPSPAKAKPCPSESREIPAPSHEMYSAEEQAKYLHELQQEEASLAEMLLLQQLQMGRGDVGVFVASAEGCKPSLQSFGKGRGPKPSPKQQASPRVRDPSTGTRGSGGQARRHPLALPD